MSPLFAALPPADLPSHAYVAPTAVHATAGRSYTVREGDTLYDIARRHGVTVDALVRANSLSQGGRWIVPGTVLRIPGAQASAAPAPVPAPQARPAGGRSSGSASRPVATGSVTVRPGDTLSHISVRTGASISSIVAANNLTNARLIYAGQVLRIPGNAGTAPAPAGPAKTTPAKSSAKPGGAPSRGQGGGTYTVRSGDTLSGIASRHGVTLAALTRANGISSQAFIHPGQRLRLPGGGSQGGGSSTPRTRPYDESNIGDHLKGQDVPDTFLHYTYGDGTARSAAANREYLASVTVPSRSEMRQMVADTARRHGVDPQLMVALSYQESGWDHRAVSPANAIGVMQVIPSSGQWASSLVGRDLNLLDPQDNVTAGVVIMRSLLRSAGSTDEAIGGYYQGLGSVNQHGLFSDTKQYVRNIKHFMKTL